MSITTPFAWLLTVLYEFTNSYGLAIILFALIVRLILFPFQMKSKRSTMRMTRIQPKMKELEKKYSGNQQKYNEEIQKLYKKEKINPMSGCIWSLIPFPILLALYSVIRQPLTAMMGLSSEQVTLVVDKLNALGAGITDTTSAYSQLPIAQKVFEHFDQIKEVVPKVLKLDFSFLGINLSEFPKDYVLGLFKGTNNAGAWVVIAMILIPILSGFFSWLSMAITQKIMGTTQERSMKTMNFIMPLISVYIAFIMPASLGLYWIAGSVFTVLQELILTTYYKKKLDAEDAVKKAEEDAMEAERERKREETARLKAENATKVNPNTSKDKIQKQERQKEIERVAEQKRINAEVSPSREGDRPFARGRAYIPDRFEHPAEESAEAEQAEESAAAEADEETSAAESAAAENQAAETAEADAKESEGESVADDTTADTAEADKGSDDDENN